MIVDTVAQERAKFLQFLFLHGDKLTEDERTLLNHSWERALDICPQGSQLKYVVEEAYELITDVSDVAHTHPDAAPVLLHMGVDQVSPPPLAHQRGHLLASLPQLA